MKPDVEGHSLTLLVDYINQNTLIKIDVLNFQFSIDMFKFLMLHLHHVLYVWTTNYVQCSLL